MRTLLSAGLWAVLAATPFTVNMVLNLVDDYEEVGHGLHPLAGYWFVSLLMLGAYAAIRLLITYEVSRVLEKGKSKGARRVKPAVPAQIATH